MSKYINSKLDDLPAKSKRNGITLSEKIEICQYKEKHPNLTRENVRLYFVKQFGHNIGKSTIGDILRCKETWLQIEVSSRTRANNN